MTSYAEFLARKAQSDTYGGFDPVWMPDFLFDFQRKLVEWATRKGKAGIFADCGLGKSPMQLVWAENVVRKTNRPVLIATPLAVSHQVVAEATKFGIDCRRVTDGKVPSGARLIVTNYERVHLFQPDDFAGMVCDESSILKNYDVRIDRVLPYREARDAEDEKHVHPLQLDVIDRCLTLWSNPGETVFTPFMGVGSEVYSAVAAGRRGVGVELKETYYRQAVKNVADALTSRDKKQPTLFAVEGG